MLPTPLTAIPTATYMGPAPTRATNQSLNPKPNPPTSPNPPHPTRATNQSLEYEPNPPTAPNPPYPTFPTTISQARSTNHKPERGTSLPNPPTRQLDMKHETRPPTASNPTHTITPQSSAKPNIKKRKLNYDEIANFQKKQPSQPPIPTFKTFHKINGCLKLVTTIDLGVKKTTRKPKKSQKSPNPKKLQRKKMAEIDDFF